MTITMDQIKQLRDKTGAGIADVKKALEEVSGDMVQAVDILRKKGIAKAAKRGDKEASEGIILATTNESGTEGYMLELNSETDFVARNEQFQDFANALFALVKAEKSANVEALLALPFDGASVKEKLDVLSGTIGEKLVVNNLAIVANDTGNVASYIHGEGRIGTLVSVTGGSAELARDIAMHVAASAPKYLSPDEVTPADMEKEKEIYTEQLINEGKPAEMIDKIITGKMAKYYEEVCLLKQLYIKDDKQAVEQILNGAKIEQFVRFALN